MDEASDFQPRKETAANPITTSPRQLKSPNRTQNIARAIDSPPRVPDEQALVLDRPSTITNHFRAGVGKTDSGLPPQKVGGRSQGPGDEGFEAPQESAIAANLRACCLLPTNATQRSTAGGNDRVFVSAPDVIQNCAKKSLPLSSTMMKAGKSSTSIRQMASMPSSSYSWTSTFLMQFFARIAAGPPIDPR